MYGLVTTFRPDSWDKYAKKMIESLARHLDSSIPVFIYYEGDLPEVTQWPNMAWVSLDEDQDRKKFLESVPDDVGGEYRFHLKRFCHKVFAITDPNRINARDDIDCWIWLDADTEAIAPISSEWLGEVCPKGFLGSYLGRKDWDHSECGFVSYHKEGYEFLEEYRKLYTSLSVTNLEQTHDSFVFDWLRGETKTWWFDISAGISGRDVFDESKLGEKFRHFKGPQKEIADGMTMENLPNGGLAVGTVDGKEGQKGLLVKTKNCVPNENIKANIHYFSTLVDNYVVECNPNDDTIVFCSGGPSLKDHIDDIFEMSQKPDHKVVCVKHAHDQLIESCIIPWACILLDPRNHVMDFIENPHPEVRYFASSMVHPTTIDQLLKNGAKVWGYHAHVGAGEDDVIRERLGNKHFMLGGGCSTAMRGISVLHSLGFKKFKLYGYDLCYSEDEVDWEKKDKHGNEHYMEVEVCGRKFITDAEKVAQAQDFTKIMKEKSIQLEVFGDGMVPHIWSSERTILPDYKEVFE